MRAPKILFVSAALGWALAGISGCATPVGLGEQLGLSPHWNWKTLETKHFRISFPEELREPSERFAQHLEEVHVLLASRLQWESPGKVQVLVIDNEDAANGLTSAVGRLGMVFLVTPPDNWFSTYYYDDWLRLLAIHEYTHFLNMDPTTDFWSVFRVAFGDVLLPNAAWPSWMLEGLAVYMETRLTTGGRGRSPYYEMVLRAAAEAGVLDTHDFVTLDRVNGHNPYYPGGETAYLFGYHLMNRLAGGPEAAKETALGEISSRSSGRIPYFINGNVENVSGKDWYALWDEWVAETRARAEAQLSKIRSNPLSVVRKLTDGGRQTLGSAFSPDGNWMAWTQDTGSQRMALWLKDLRTGTVRVAEEKLLGSSMAFTPDSSAILMSSLRRNSKYLIYSDLGIHDVASGKTSWLTEGLRARDPDVSRDGTKVVFTRTQDATTGLAVATLGREGGEWKLSDIETLFVPSRYDAVHTPKFSADGKRVVFSWHPNGKTQEDLAEIDLETRKLTSLVADGSFNRFPTIAPDGTIHFISDRTGVENVYRLDSRGPSQVTNVTTGLSFPSFDPSGKLHANVFAPTGWDLAEVEAPRDPAKASEAIDPAAAPNMAASAREPSSDSAPGPIEDYSVFPSLWPRQWAPLLLLRPQSALIGGQVLGFDAIDLHRYLITAAYDSQTSKGDWSVLYANRQLGPTLTLTGENTTSSVVTDPQFSLLNYTRTLKLGADLSFPIPRTFSVITPSVAVKSERASLFIPGTASPVSQTRHVPSIEGRLSYSDAESSTLAITAEKGRSTVLGARLYFDDPTPTWKALIKDSEYLSLTEHSVLVPTLKASWTSRQSTYSLSQVNVEGRVGDLFETLSGDSLDELSIRGYPGRLFYSRAAGGASLDYRFPLLRIFRGWGTNPAYLDNLFGFAFAEATYFPGTTVSTTLPSAGAGLRLSGDVFLHIPVVLSLEYHRGFREEYGGRGEFFFQMGFSNFGF